MEDSLRIRLLKYIAEHQPVSALQLKSDLNISVGSLYHHLSKLKGFVFQDRSKRYLITEYGINYLKSQDRAEKLNVRAVDPTAADIALTGDKRRNILEYVAKKGLASIKEMRSLQMSTGSLYHHLHMLMEEGLVTQSGDKRYALTLKSFNLLKSGMPNPPSYIQVEGSADHTAIQDTAIKTKRAQGIEDMLKHPKVRLLQYISEAGHVRIPDVREFFGVSRGTAKTWLKRLKEYLTTDQYGRYVLNEKGKNILNSIHDKETLEGFLYRKPKTRSRSRFTSPMPLRKQRSVYDTIAMILSSKDGIVYQSRVIRAFGISHKDASPLLAYMESKGFIERVDTKSLPMPYSKMPLAEFWKVTGKGKEYLQRYNSLVSII